MRHKRPKLYTIRVFDNRCKASVCYKENTFIARDVITAHKLANEWITENSPPNVAWCKGWGRQWDLRNPSWHRRHPSWHLYIKEKNKAVISNPKWYATLNQND